MTVTQGPKEDDGQVRRTRSRKGRGNCIWNVIYERRIKNGDNDDGDQESVVITEAVIVLCVDLT